jgi:nitrate/TMAO reductase-like tetraheme cytochrome c subunit
VTRRRRPPLPIGALAGPLLLAGAALADTPPSAYSPPRDIAEEWAMILSFLLIVVSAALILYTLVVRRDRIMDDQSKWLLFVGIAVLPLPAILLAGVVGVEHSKGVAFCSSCHPMDPFVDDMRDPDSELLAAVHYKNRFIQREHCYTCHTDYGIFGTIESKLAGLGHIYMDATGRWETPIALNRPYRFRICLNCHAGAQRFENEEDHEDVIEEVVNGESECTECHETSHPSRRDRS